MEVNDAANQDIVYLAHAPQSIIDRLNAAHPGTYVIHNDAPRTHETLMRLENSFDFEILKPEGIQVFSVGPSVDGYLEVGVSSNVAEAQEKLDGIYGRNVVHVFKGEAAMLANLTVTGPTFARVSAIRSTHVRRADAAEVRMWRKEPRAFMVASNPRVLRFVLPGAGCAAKGVSGRVKGKTLILWLRPAGTICTTPALFYEVTLRFARGIVSESRIKKVVARYGSSRQPMRLVTVP